MKPNKRFVPIYPEDEAETLIEIQRKNALFVTRSEALKQRDKKGNKPVGLIILEIIPLEG